MEELQRVIGRYTGTQRGPLLIAIGGVHGNEPAGVLALEEMFDMLLVEPRQNPQFRFSGRLLGLRGNLRAMREGKRFIHKDLNRQWTRENIARIRASAPEQRDAEDWELLELTDLIEAEVADYQPDKLVLLDFHTTTAYGGIFSIATNDPESLRIAVELHAPVVTGLLDGIRGTSLHYFCQDNFAPETVAVCFESGQHQEPLSVKRAIAALTNCMRSIGCVRAQDVENRHDKLLIEYSTGLPKVAELIRIHSIQPEDEFEMVPGFKNFQAIHAGQLLAHDRHGPIHAPQDGLILMPLYQPQGEDGFFLIKKVEGY